MPMKLNARELRDVDETELQDQIKKLKRHPVYFILENIYDTYNIGGIFRLADAIGVEKMYICGQTEIPPNHKIKKASIGTYKVVPWEYCKTASEAIEKLRAEKPSVGILAVEQDKNSVPYTQAEYTWPVALLLGNETYGVLPETLKQVDQVVEIPMWGINKSLNVIISAGIVSYWMMKDIKVEGAS